MYVFRVPVLCVCVCVCVCCAGGAVKAYFTPCVVVMVVVVMAVSYTHLTLPTI